MPIPEGKLPTFKLHTCLSGAQSSSRALRVPYKAVELLPFDVLQSLPRTSTAQGDMVTLPTSSFVSDNVLKYVRDPVIRKAMYIETYKENPEVWIVTKLKVHRGTS